MPFSLTIQEGNDQGKQYSFTQAQISIGRTNDNDVVLVDPGVSRKHVVIREEAGRFLVQDMGSSNGTQVNGAPVSEGELHPGDVIAIGPVLLAFEAEIANASTRIVSSGELVAAKRKSAGGQMSRPTTSIPSRPAPSARPRPGAPSVSRPAAGAPPKPTALAGGARPTGSMPARKPTLTASEKSRMQRKGNKLLAPLRVFLAERPPAVRYAIVGSVAVLLLVGILAGLSKLTGGGPLGFQTGQDFSHERMALSDQRDENVYGWGEELGVTVPTRDELHLVFDSDVTDKVYYLRYQALGVESATEVEISLNGVQVGQVPVSGLGDYVKTQRLRLPRKHLKPAGEANEVVFDHTANPPRAEPWAIQKVSLEIKPLLACERNDCLAKATYHFQLAEELILRKDVAAANRYQAYTNLNKALLFLEAVEPKPDLYGLAQQRTRELEVELEKKCTQILLSGKRAEQLKKFDVAMREYKDGLNWFPEYEHDCRSRLEALIEQYGG